MLEPQSKQDVLGRLLADFKKIDKEGLSTHEGTFVFDTLSSNAVEFEKSYALLSRGCLPFRINHWSWWKQELPSDEEMEEGRQNLEKHNYEVDFIVTHCCSVSTQALLGHGLYS